MLCRPSRQETQPSALLTQPRTLRTVHPRRRPRMSRVQQATPRRLSTRGRSLSSMWTGGPRKYSAQPPAMLRYPTGCPASTHADVPQRSQDSCTIINMTCAKSTTLADEETYFSRGYNRKFCARLDCCFQAQVSGLAFFALGLTPAELVTSLP